jgi:hypothetical protein
MQETIAGLGIFGKSMAASLFIINHKRKSRRRCGCPDVTITNLSSD